MRQTESATLTPEQHEREHLGLKTQRDGDTARITAYARTLNGTNAPQLRLRAGLLLDGGVRSLALDLSRCDRGLDEKGIGALVSIGAAVREAGGAFEVVFEALNPVESFSLVQRASHRRPRSDRSGEIEWFDVSPSGRSTRQENE
jgi:hypothetical protein